MFGLAEHNVDYSLGVDDDSHRLNHINFFHPCVDVSPSQPNNVDDLHIHQQPCS